MPKSLIIVEFKEEVDFFCRQHPEFFKEKVEVLSLLPEASARLSEKNIHYHNTLNYFSKQSHEETLVCVDRIIQKINEAIVIEDEEGITHTYLNSLTFYLRLYLSYLHFTLEVIKNFIEQNNIQQVYVCRYKNVQRGQEFLVEERILNQIVGLVVKNLHIDMREFVIEQKVQSHALREWGRAFYRMLFCHLALLQYKSYRKPSILFYSLRFNFDQMVKSIGNCLCYNLIRERGYWFQFIEKKCGVDIHNLQVDCFWPHQDAKLDTTLDEAMRTLETWQYEKKTFVYKGIDFSTIVLRKLTEDFVHQFKILNRKIVSLKRILKTLQPSVIVSPMSRELSFALGELSRLLAMPSVLISHGSHVPPKNQYDRMEWLDHGKGLIDTDYQYHLLQSPWAVQYVEAMAIPKNYHKVLPIIFTKVDRTKKAEKQIDMYPESRGKKIIVHASTPKPRGSNRLYIYETLDEYIENIKDFIAATKDMKDVLFIIRFRSSDYLTLVDLKRLLPSSDHYVIASQGSFNDYLQIADLMVSFSSTTIEEALMNAIPVLQYDRTGRYKHLEGAEWRTGQFSHVDSVYYIGNVTYLDQGIRWIVEHHLSQSVHKELFERHVFDPEKTMTVAEFIHQLVYEQKKPVSHEAVSAL